MVKNSQVLAHHRPHITIDSMGVKVALRRSGGNPDAVQALPIEQDVQSVQNSGASTNKIIEKHRRNKGMEKSVLDDIMGDPDDFGDLGDLDAGSESDGGRWEDTFRAGIEGEVDVSTTMIPLDNMCMKGIEKASSDGTPKENASMVDSSLTDCKQEPEILEEPGSSSQRGHGKQHCRNNEGRVRHASNAVANVGSSKEGKLHSTRYFIIKSLSHHNIQMSIEKGIWATQVMNEPVLEEAFQNSERVILIFSVNMSGYFQGYAQMMSPVGWRRANVWSESNNGANPWGRTFKVKWLRLYNLPFQRTVHLKNPLNDYKPVKISRDCQELTQEIGEALCSLIDGGAEVDGKQKRKIAVRDTALAKRLHIESPTSTADGKYMGGILASQVNWAITPMLYSSTQYPFGTLHEPCNSSGVLVPNRISSHLEQPKGSRSRSPLLSGKNSDRHRERERSSGTDVTKERPRVGGNLSHAIDLVAEEDLLHMTYEEYLQVHGKTNDYGGCNQTSLGWMGNSADLIDEQYSNYLANWYRSQNPMLASNGCYVAPQIINTYPAIHHP